MAFRKKTLKKSKYAKKTAKRIPYKGGAPPRSPRPSRPDFMESFGNLSPIRSIPGSPITLNLDNDSFSFSPQTSPNRTRSSPPRTRTPRSTTRRRQ